MPKKLTADESALNGNGSDEHLSGDQSSGSRYNLRSTRSKGMLASGEALNGHHENESTNGRNSCLTDLDILREERAKLVLWRSPIMTMWYFLLELLSRLQDIFIRLTKRWRQVIPIVVSIGTLLYAYEHFGWASLPQVVNARKQAIWCAYWVFLGILSSVGLGSGLHTFVLYLGPHIAKVTLAAYECQSMDFPEPPYPNDIVCPKSSVPVSITIWDIMAKVRVEAFMWGLGTAIGELPPYFVARAARLSGRFEDDAEAEDEIAQVEALMASSPDQLGIADRLKLKIHWLIQKVGFFGILACASIPNPLFDLAGITCGHFLVPFATFFGATAIGKAVIKMHIQMIFVIFLFSKHHVDHFVRIIGSIPGGYGSRLHKPFQEFLENQKRHLHSAGADGSAAGDTSVIKSVFEILVGVMVLYFVLSIVNWLAQSYHHRVWKRSKLGQQPLKAVKKH